VYKYRGKERKDWKERVYEKLKEGETSYMFCLIKAEKDKHSDPWRHVLCPLIILRFDSLVFFLWFLCVSDVFSSSLLSLIWFFSSYITEIICTDDYELSGMRIRSMSMIILSLWEILFPRQFIHFSMDLVKILNNRHVFHFLWNSLYRTWSLSNEGQWVMKFFNII